MAYADVLESLFDEGRVIAGMEEEIPPDELAAGDLVLARAERRWRLEMPSPGVAFDPGAARWGALQFYRACQFIVYRTIEAATISDFLRREPARPEAAPTLYSVDLTLRYLPDLVRRARTAAPDDPLVGELLEFARRWPLSAVGIRGLTGERRIDPVVADPSLLQLYVDRVTQHADREALDDQRVREALDRNLGAHRELSPELARLLDASPDERRSETS
ncbi:MAG: hypothetical protein QGG36_27725 [Pirellulaceae bacterium]|jgi:hypothetical protein|nr:hypothetical protein [Pirellulaceae bacterium]MDP7019617.1 hypothetical protein [Pirellulaceae bacterium]